MGILEQNRFCLSWCNATGFREIDVLMADRQSDCITPGFSFKYIESVFLFVWNSLRDGIILIKFSKPLGEIQSAFEGDAFEENSMHARSANST